MILKKIGIRNFRSIKKAENIPLQQYQALVGENNSGKSNVLNALDVFLSAGVGGVDKECFYDRTQPIVIQGIFTGMTETERKRWRPYLVNNELILEKHITLEPGDDSSREKITFEFHGYQAEPKLWYLSLKKITEEKGQRPIWREIVTKFNLPDYFLESGKCNKSIYSKALERYLLETEVEYDKPDLSSTQALGLKSNVIASLPTFYLLKAVSDYSAETDKRSSSTTFRRLMADLSERIIQKDERFKELNEAINTINALLGGESSKEIERLESLKLFEKKFTEILRNLMPSVKGTALSVETETFQTIFSRGVGIRIDDGIATDVLAKGHGLQRCIIFTLLQSLILNQRNQLIPQEDTESDKRTIILGVEEPELYIHPQLSKLFNDVLQEFSKTDQVIFSTHSPLFIDAASCESIAIVSKRNYEQGTEIKVCDITAFDGLSGKKIYKGYTRFNPEINEMFFAKKVILVEGPEDRIALTYHFQHEAKIQNRMEELDMTVIVAGGKQSIPFFQRVLNAFDIPYIVIHDLDIKTVMDTNSETTEKKRNKDIKDLIKGNAIITFPVSLEESLGLSDHLKDQYKAYQHFSIPENYTDNVKSIFNQVLIKN